MAFMFICKMRSDGAIGWMGIMCAKNVDEEGGGSLCWEREGAGYIKDRWENRLRVGKM